MTSRTVLLAGALVAVWATNAVPADPEKPASITTETVQQKQARLAWWTHDRFGLFIHWGLYALPARHEWVRNYEHITDEAYAKYFPRFDPDLYDPRAWARQAKAAGMKYAVLTTKHHEGFCLWDSAYTDYKATNTPAGRDLVKEFVEAFRAEGLKVGFYYSLIDWHHPDFTIDYYHPLCELPKEEIARLNAPRDMARYRAYMKNQVRELMTKYGKIDIMWFDFSYPAQGDFGKNWKDWDAVGLLKLARELNPDVIVDNRLDLNDVAGGYDFVTPEQVDVTEWPTVDGVRQPWERCQTFSGSWGYHRDEQTWKSVPQLLKMLVDGVAHGGNLILNVGPTARGEFDDRATERLAGIGAWMRVNARSVYGCTEAPAEFLSKALTLTYNPGTNRLYVHLTGAYPTDGQLSLPFVDRVAYAQFLHDASELPLTASGLKLPAAAPRIVNPVVELYLK